MRQILFILMAGIFVFKSFDAWAVEMTSPISIKIEMDTDTFTPLEPIEGKVVLTSMAPVQLHAVFDVSIFLNGSLQQSFSIGFRSVFPGTNPFSFKDFSIHLPAQAGRWRLVIKQQGLDEDQAATADFVIKPSS